MIQFKCNNCGRGLRAKDEHAGKTLKCPNCEAPTKIPAETSSRFKAADSAPAAQAAAVATETPATVQTPAAVQAPAAPQSSSAVPAGATGQNVVVQVPQQPAVQGTKKSSAMANFLVGIAIVCGFSGHRFYLGRYGSAILQTMLCWIGLPLLFVIIGIIPLGIWFIWLMMDVFGGTSRMVRNHNAQFA